MSSPSQGSNYWLAITASRRRKSLFQLLQLNDFGKGLVLSRPATLLDPSEAQVAENVDLREGFIRRRSGYSTVGALGIDPTSPVDGLFAKYDPSGSNELLAMAEDKLFSSSGGDFTQKAVLRPSIRAFSGDITGTATSGVTIPIPDGAQNGDFLLAAVKIADSTKNVVVPAGWTALNAAASTMFMWKLADDEVQRDPTTNKVTGAAQYLFSSSTVSATIGMVGKIWAIANADPTTPVHKWQESNGATSSAALAGVTTTLKNCLLLGLVGSHAAGVLTSSAPGDMAERYDFGTDPGTAASLTGASRNMDTPGASGTETFTLSGTPTAWRGGLLAIAPATGQRPTFAQALDNVYIATEDSHGSASALRYYDGSTVSVVPGGPAGRCVLFHEGALWVSGGNTTDANRVWFSRQIPNQGTFPPNNYVDVAPGDGDIVTGLTTLQGVLFALKQRSIARITGYPPDDADKSDSNLAASTYVERQPGCIAPRSVATNNTVILYLNRQGIYAYNGTKALELTEEIRPLFFTLKESELRNAVGGFIEDDHYILSVTTSHSDKPNLVVSVRLLPQLVISTWRGYPIADLGDGQTSSDLNVSAVTTFPFSGTTYPVLGLRGKVVKMDNSYTDDGSRIRYTYRSGILPMGDASGQKFIRRGWLSVAPGSGTVSLTFLPNYATEDIVGIDLNPSNVTTSAEEAVTIPFPAVGSARRWAVEISGEGDGPSPEIHELTLEHFSRFRN